MTTTSTSKAPKWAVDLLTLVCNEYGIEVPTLTWRRSRKQQMRWSEASGRWLSGRDKAVHSSGRYFTKQHRIVVTAGSSRVDQRLVLLHEIAHALTLGEHHSDRFWTFAFTLYRRHRVPVRYAQQREYAYRKNARAGYETATRMSG